METTPLLARETRSTTISTSQQTSTCTMLETKHHWLPIILSVFLPITFSITYVIAVANDHVEPGFPYISDTGTFPPESCVFGQLLNIGAVISGIIVYIRYRHIYILFENVPERRSLLRINLAAFCIGMATNFGVSMVGNFQESNVLPVHLIGAFLAFFVGFIYCILQTVISYKTAGTSQMMGNTPTIRTVRVVLCVMDAIFIVMLIGATGLAILAGPGPGKTRYKWTSDDPGYTEHLIATVSEWLAAFAVVAYFATFYHEFKHFRVTAPRIVHYNDTDKEAHEQTNGVSTITNSIT